MSANAVRGEARLRVGAADVVLRPTFGALVAAEAELRPLFALIDRAAAGELCLNTIVGLFWHCVAARPDGLTREMLGEAVVAQGIIGVTPALRILLQQILRGA